jgi:hypothetical protein
MTKDVPYLPYETFCCKRTIFKSTLKGYREAPSVNYLMFRGAPQNGLWAENLLQKFSYKDKNL